MSRRALLFSSDETATRVLREALLAADWSVDCCRHTAATIENLGGQQYGIVVIDALERRERDGVLRQLRCSPLNKEALAVVAVSTQAHAPTAFAAGANFLLYRPLVPERVRAALAAASRLLQRDRRRKKRTSVHAAADLSCPAVESAPATLLDLSEDGLSLQCDHRVPAHSKIYLRFTLPGQTKSIQLSGEVTWQDSNRRVGLQFVAVPQTARRLLREWLDSNLSMSQSKVRVELPLGQLGRVPNARSERRTQSRHSCRLGADIYRAGEKVPHRCTLSDISAGGFYVEMTAPFSVGTAVEVVVRTENFKFLSAGTVQKTDWGFGMGVAFATQSARQRAQVQELIKMAFREREASGDPILNF
ncbi:MAG: PilZ domain-containing protein [Acidobacteria bacterium]|nr:PilZ domain-containing protein [Acidobacteriota bacterium]